MSVDVEPPMLAAGLAPAHYAVLAGKGAVRITARKARELGMRVGPEPVDGNIHHGGIWEPNPALSGNQLRRRIGELSRSCEVVERGP